MGMFSSSWGIGDLSTSTTLLLDLICEGEIMSMGDLLTCATSEVSTGDLFISTVGDGSMGDLLTDDFIISRSAINKYFNSISVLVDKNSSEIYLLVSV